MSRSRRVAAALMVLGLSSLPLPAHAADQADALAVEAQLAADGALRVSQTLSFAAGAPDEVGQQLVTREDVDRTTYREFTITGLSASVDGRPVAIQPAAHAGKLEVSVPTKGARKVVISYTVAGATFPAAASGTAPAGVQLVWPLVQGLSVGAKEVSGRVKSVAPITFVDCEAGPQGSHQPCATFQGGQMPDADPQFTEVARRPGDQVILTFGQPAGSVASTQRLGHRWSLDHAFSVNGRTLLACLLPLLLGTVALYALHRRIGRDEVDLRRITPVAEFHPVAEGQSAFRVLADVRPGHVGTVADETVDPIDVTATLLDLAVRGWLRIVELPREGLHKPLDWTFERREAGEGELRDYEQLLRDAVAPAGAEPVKVSSITQAVASVVPQVQDSLYDEVVARGWFDRRPDQTRSRWSLLGWAVLALAVLASVAIVAWTTFGLVTVSLLGLAAGLLVVAQEMPRRTVAGAALLGGLSALSSQLLTQPTNQLPAGREASELARVLPYAVVLGGADRWLEALVACDDDDDPDGEDLDWYHAPETWHLQDLPESIRSFITTVQGRLFVR